MITFSAAKGAACEVTADDLSFTVFPKQPAKGRWSLMSHPEEELKEKVVSWPGEYDFGGATVRAIGQEEGRQISYTCAASGVRLAFIDAPLVEWSDADIEGMGDIDVLVIAAEDAKKVSALAETIDPRLVILFPAEKGDIAQVASACGKADGATVSEFKVKPGSLPSDTRQVVILK